MKKAYNFIFNGTLIEVEEYSHAAALNKAVDIYEELKKK